MNTQNGSLLKKVSTRFNHLFGVQRFSKHRYTLNTISLLKKVPYVWQVARYAKNKIREKTLLKYRPPLPINLFIDPSSICNLSCPLCPTGAGTANLQAGVLPFEQFKSILDQFDENLAEIFLYNWGEPFLNKDIFKIIALATERKIKTAMDSNFSLIRDDKFFENIVTSGLTKLRVSCDGASQASYEKYRVGGDFELVYNNMKRLREMQKKLGRKEPLIIWKFLVNRYTENELEKAKAMAEAIDVEINFEPFLLTNGYPDEQSALGGSVEDQEKEWLPTNEKYLWEYYADYHKKKKKQYPIIDAPCNWLFDSVVVHSDGTVLPCCFVSSERTAFGNALKTPLKEIWNSDQYLYARSLFLEEEYHGPKPKIVCEECPLFKQTDRNQNRNQNRLVQIQPGAGEGARKFAGK